MTFRIFISYSQDDFLAKARKLRNYLAKVIPDSYVYIDQLKPKGKEWRKNNDKELLKSKLVVLAITPAVLYSDEVKREIELAKKNSITILPCKHDDIQKSWEELPLKIGKIDGIEFDDDETLKTKLYKEITNIIDSEKPNIMAYGEGWGITYVIVNNQSFKIIYETIGGNFLSPEAKVDRDTSSLIFSTRCTIETKVKLNIPRELIDAKSNGDDDPFFILLDDAEINFEELPSIKEEERVLRVIFPPNVKNMEIIGTQILGITGGKRSKTEHLIHLPKDSDIPNNEKFAEPETLKIKQGETVTWSNDDSAAHTLTSGDPSDVASVGTMFDSGLILEGSTFSLTFEKKGRFPYFCIVHPWKVCEIIVE